MLFIDRERDSHSREAFFRTTEMYVWLVFVYHGGCVSVRSLLLFKQMINEIKQGNKGKILIEK